MTRQQIPTRAELYVRSLAPNGNVESQVETIERLERLEERDVLSSCSVHVVGRGIVHETCCALTPTGRLLLDRLSVIEQWAERNSADLPGIETRTVSGSIQPTEPYTVTTLPSALLLEYDGDQLTRVSPATVDGVHHCVRDHLDALEAGGDRPETVSVPVAREFDTDTDPVALDQVAVVGDDRP